VRRARTKILTRAEAVKKLRGAERRGERVVLTNGCFDLLHVGHVRSLEQARGLGDRLIVAINSDASVRELKGRGRPVVPLRQRLEMVAALECVDWVILFRDATPLSTIRALRPDVLAMGREGRLDKIVDPDEVRAWGGRIVRLREVPGVRVRALIERIQQGG
jgi:D-beta-D-heptose 7-phosphate kinase/D-beta-D-heptose 1-phosphate adenosyltransferase